MSAEQAPFGRAVSGATPKQLLLFRLMQERTHLLGAYQGLSAAQLAEPMGEGRPSVRDVVATLASWEVAVTDALPAARDGVEPPLRAAPVEEQERWSRQQLEGSRGLELDEVMRGLQVTRLELLDQVEGMPERPAEQWQPDHHVWWLLDLLARRDRAQADAIKTWRQQKGY